MRNHKKLRERGKMAFSEYFKTLKEGDRVALVRESSLPREFPDRMQGCTGIVKSKRGEAYVVAIKDLGLEKQFTVRPIHLKKLTPQ